jgi:hypothetical protein
MCSCSAGQREEILLRAQNHFDSCLGVPAPVSVGEIESALRCG